MLAKGSRQGSMHACGPLPQLGNGMPRPPSPWVHVPPSADLLSAGPRRRCATPSVSSPLVLVPSTLSSWGQGSVQCAGVSSEQAAS